MTNAKSLDMYKVFLVILIKIVSKFVVNTILVKIHELKSLTHTACVLLIDNIIYENG